MTWSEVDDSVVCKIPSNDARCEEAYFGRTYRGLKKRLSEFVAAFNKHDQQSTFPLHAWANEVHQPVWKKAEVVHKGVESKRKRLFLESAIIRTSKNFNSGTGQISNFCLGKIPALATFPRSLAS